MIPLKDNPHWDAIPKPLSPRSKQVFSAIEHQMAVSGVPCTIHEVALVLGISTQAVEKHITRLRRNGWVRRLPRYTRHVVPTIGIEPFLERVRTAVWEMKQGTPLEAAARRYDVPEGILSAIRSYLPLACSPD